MRNLIISLALIFIAISSLQSQSLKSISTDKNVSLKKSISFSNTDSNQIMKSNKSLKKKNGDYISLSFGIMYSKNEKPFFGAFDMNINLGFIASIFYLNMGIYGINTSTKNYFGAQITPGLGINLFHNKIFAFAGIGYLVIIPYLGYNASLRINYSLSETLSFGLDNKYIFSGNSCDCDIYSIG